MSTPAPDDIDARARAIAEIMSHVYDEAAHPAEEDAVQEAGALAITPHEPAVVRGVVTKAKYDDDKHPRGQPGNAGQFTSGSASGGKGKDEEEEDEEEEPEEEEPEPFEWDGTIDADRVDEGRARSLQSWSAWDGGTEAGGEVNLVRGEYATNPDDPDSETVDVWRWEAVVDNDTVDQGDWTADEDEARTGGKDYASEHEEEAPDLEDSDIDEDEIENRDVDTDAICYFIHNGIEDNWVRLETGTFTYGGQDHDVYRFTTRRHDDGDWTLSRRQAVREGERYAEEMHEEPEEDEPEEASLDLDILDQVPPPKKRDVTLTDEPLPKSKAGVSVAKGVDEALSDKIVGTLFGGDVGDSHDALTDCLGMPDDSDIEIVEAGSLTSLFSDDLPLNAVGVRVKIKNPKFGRCSRFIGVDAEGKRFIRNEIIEIKDQYQGEGLGADIFSKQVESAVQNGFDYIQTHAAKGPKMNGYATWPKFGYNQRLDDPSIHGDDKKVFQKAKELFPDAETVLDILSTKEGEEWWCGKKNPDGSRTKGNGTDLHDARFDMSEGSRSLEVLKAYLKKTQARKGATKTSTSQRTKSKPWTKSGPTSTSPTPRPVTKATEDDNGAKHDASNGQFTSGGGGASSGGSDKKPKDSNAKGQRVNVHKTVRKAKDQPRGQPDNAGQFASVSGGGGKGKDEKKPHAEEKPERQRQEDNAGNFPAESQPKLSENQRRAVRLYVLGDYVDLNQSLRDGTPLSEKDTKINKGLQEALAKTKEFAQPVSVGRKMRLSDEELATFVAKMEEAVTSTAPVTVKGYISTTGKSDLFAGASCNVHLHIQAKRGLEAGSYIPDVSWAKSEKELLLDDQSQFRIAKVEKVTHNDTEIAVIHMDQLPVYREPPAEEVEPAEKPKEKPRGLWSRLFGKKKSLTTTKEDDNRFVDTSSDAFVFADSDSEPHNRPISPTTQERAKQTTLAKSAQASHNSIRTPNSRTKALSETGGPSGGYTVMPDTTPEVSEEHLSEPKEQLKEGIVGALSQHLGDGSAEEANGHVVHYNPGSGQVHHSHPEGADMGHLTQIKEALETVPGVTSVSQEADKSVPPEGEGWEHAFGIGKDMASDEESADVEVDAKPEKTKGELEDEEALPPDEDEPTEKDMDDDDDMESKDMKEEDEEEETPKEKQVVGKVQKLSLSRVQRFLKHARKKAHWKIMARATIKSRVLAKRHPKLSKARMLAVAYGLCGVKKLLKDLNQAAPGGMNELEDETDETIPHGVDHAKKTLAHHIKAMPKMHPADKDFYKSMCDTTMEHATAEYPEHAKEIAEAGAELEPGKAGDAGFDGEESDSGNETEAALAPYKSFRPVAIKRLVRQLGAETLAKFQSGAALFKELAALPAGSKLTVGQATAVKALAREYRDVLKMWGTGDTQTPVPVETKNLDAVAAQIGKQLFEEAKTILYPITGRMEHKPAANGFSQASK